MNVRWFGFVAACTLALSAGAQTATMGPQTATYSGNTRGYWFTAPANFTITGVQVLLQTGSSNTVQNFAIVRFTGAVPPPTYSSTTNAFTQEALGLDLPQGFFQPVNVVVQAGDVIGVYGNTAASTGTTSGQNSYAGNVQQTTVIAGSTVNLYRSGMQFHLGSATSPTGMHDVWAEPASFSISRVEFTYTTGPGAPTGYCTAGTSSNGCTASISASAQPSLTQANACTLSVANVEGQRTGMIFYGINNTSYAPLAWGTGGSSFLCVKSPWNRTPVQSSGGNLGQCDGTLQIDWNAFQSQSPAALGNPWASGANVFVQAWYLDPPAVKSSNTSNAVQLTYVP